MEHQRYIRCSTPAHTQRYVGPRQVLITASTNPIDISN